MIRVWRALGMVIGLLAFAVVAVNLYFATMITWWRDHAPRETSFMAERMRELERKSPGAQLRYQFVPYDRIAGSLKRAMIAAEDSKFVEHEGFDWDAIQRAYEKNLKKGKIVAGGSTISQQLAKNLFLSGRRSPWRKAEEALITVMIETVMSKQRIFEIYLNIIEWGNSVYGAEAASRYYFNHSAANLDAWEAARLAAMVPKPRYYDRNRHTPWLERKTNLILGWMPSVQVP